MKKKSILFLILISIANGCGVKKVGKPIYVPISEPVYQKNMTDQYDQQGNNSAPLQIIPWLE